MCQHFFAEFPCRAVVIAAHRAPAKGIGSDIGENPARRLSISVLAVLNDLIALEASHEYIDVVVCRPDKHDVPSIDLRIVIADRRSPFTFWRSRLFSLQSSGHDPHVSNGTAF